MHKYGITSIVKTIIKKTFSKLSALYKIIHTISLLAILITPLFTQDIDSADGRIDSADSRIDSADRGIDMDAIRAENNFQWGVRAFHNGHFNQAIFYFEKALSNKPQNIIERVWLGKSFYRSGFEEAALNEWNKILGRGKGTSLLAHYVQVINLRRGLAPELEGSEQFVISQILDVKNKKYYQFRRPSSIKAREDGTFYVVAFGTNEVILLDINGTVLNILKGGIEGFDHPFDIVESDDGFLFISEYEGNRISKCNIKGERLQVIGKKGRKEGELLGPQFLAIDEKGYLYVSDYGNRRVNKYDIEGNFILSIKGSKAKYSELAAPTGLAIKGEIVFIADKIKKEIFVYDDSGNYIGAYGKDFLKGPEGLYLLGQNTLLVTDTAPFMEVTRILKFDLDKEKWSVLSNLSKDAENLISVSVDQNGDLFTVDFNSNKILTLSNVSKLASSYFVQIERVEAINFPEVIIDVSVEDRFGEPVIGLNLENFIITESFRAVKNVQMYKPVQQSDNFQIAILIEKSKNIQDYKKDLETAIKSISNDMGENRSLLVVSAGNEPVFDAGISTSKLKKVEVITKGDYSDDWKFDMGLRLAGTKLLPLRSKKAVIFLSSGSIDSKFYSKYSLLELVNYLKNNHISFYAINFSNKTLHEDIQYLCNETGGKMYYYYAPGGLKGLINQIREHKDSRYIFKYESFADSRFGRKLIGVEVEVNLRKRSGRDETGYFGPIEF